MASSLDPREAEDTKTGPAAGDGEKPQQHVSSAATASSSWEADREMVVGSTAVFVDKVAERSYGGWLLDFFPICRVQERCREMMVVETYLFPFADSRRLL